MLIEHECKQIATEQLTDDCEERYTCVISL